MKATGIVRRLDELGRVVIPIELRRTLEMEDAIVKRMLWRFTAKACAENA